jgi:hypothetical protein
MKKIDPIVLNNEKGLLNKKGSYHFLNEENLIGLFIKIYYRQSVMIVLPDCMKAFETIPKLIVLKRDNFSAFRMGSISDYVFIEFESVKKAEDFVYSFPMKSKLKFFLFSNTRLIMTEEGKTKED